MPGAQVPRATQRLHLPGGDMSVSNRSRKRQVRWSFTVEEVENVKMVFKLIPLIVCITGALLVNRSTSTAYYFHGCAIKSIPFLFSLLWIAVILSWLPIYHFLIYPFFYNCVPSMLRRIGIGICLIRLVTALRLRNVFRIH